MLHSEAVIEVLKNAQHPLACKTIARRLKITRKNAYASLLYAQKVVDSKVVMTIRCPLNVNRKRRVWTYKSS